MKSQLTLQIAIQYPEVYALAWLYLNSAQCAKPSDKAKKNRLLRKIIEFAVITFAGFINPEAANWAIPALKVCFMLLDYLQKGQNK
jgi:hypothetical protein